MTDPAEMTYCPRCGQSLSDALKFGRTRRVCDACGFIHFRDPKVAAVVLVTQGDAILMVKRGVVPEKGKWSVPGGYIDFGEDPRDAAIREIVEETGLDVRITRLIEVIGPDGSGGASIVIMFEAEVIGGSLHAEDDVEEAAFFTADNLPAEIASFQSTQMMIADWLERVKSAASPLDNGYTD